jgi:hypothetical protein
MFLKCTQVENSLTNQLAVVIDRVEGVGE